jgi:hypothetical protein
MVQLKPSVCQSNSLLVFNATLCYYLTPVLGKHETSLVIPRHSLAISPCIVLLHSVLLHTVRMSWRLCRRFFTKGYVREYFCRQSGVQR